MCTFQFLKCSLVCLVPGWTLDSVLTLVTIVGQQGFMQDKIIASHICFGGHMDVNC